MQFNIGFAFVLLLIASILHISPSIILTLTPFVHCPFAKLPICEFIRSSPSAFGWSLANRKISSNHPQAETTTTLVTASKSVVSIKCAIEWRQLQHYQSSRFFSMVAWCYCLAMVWCYRFVGVLPLFWWSTRNLSQIDVHFEISTTISWRLFYLIVLYGRWKPFLRLHHSKVQYKCSLTIVKSVFLVVQFRRLSQLNRVHICFFFPLTPFWTSTDAYLYNGECISVTSLQNE